MSIRAVIFDLVEVISRHQRTADLDAGGLPALPRDARQRLFRDHPVFKASLIGQATMEEARDAVIGDLAHRLGLTGDQVAALRRVQLLPEMWDQELLAFIRGLRSQYKTALLTDAWLSTRADIQPRLGDDTFDVIVISAEEGVAKPDPEIYRRTLVRLGVAAEEAIFVDDWLPNVEGAAALGIHAIQFESSQQAMVDIQLLLRAA